MRWWKPKHSFLSLLPFNLYQCLFVSLSIHCDSLKTKLKQNLLGALSSDNPGKPFPDFLVIWPGANQTSWTWKSRGGFRKPVFSARFLSWLLCIPEFGRQRDHPLTQSFIWQLVSKHPTCTRVELRLRATLISKNRPPLMQSRVKGAIQVTVTVKK